jgi:hypothetical protein
MQWLSGMQVWFLQRLLPIFAALLKLFQQRKDRQSNQVAAAKIVLWASNRL